MNNEAVKDSSKVDRLLYTIQFLDHIVRARGEVQYDIVRYDVDHIRYYDKKIVIHNITNLLELLPSVERLCNEILEENKQ